MCSATTLQQRVPAMHPSLCSPPPLCFTRTTSPVPFVCVLTWDLRHQYHIISTSCTTTQHTSTSNYSSSFTPTTTLCACPNSSNALRHPPVPFGKLHPELLLGRRAVPWRERHVGHIHCEWSVGAVRCVRGETLPHTYVNNTCHNRRRRTRSPSSAAVGPISSSGALPCAQQRRGPNCHGARALQES